MKLPKIYVQNNEIINIGNWDEQRINIYQPKVVDKEVDDFENLDKEGHPSKKIVQIEIQEKVGEKVLNPLPSDALCFENIDVLFIDGKYYLESYAPIPNLTPRQFSYLTIVLGLEDALDHLLSILKSQNITKYADFKSQLTLASTYEYKICVQLLSEYQDYLLEINNELDLSEKNLKSKWLEASQL